MRQKILLRRRAAPLNITLLNGTTFAARYERTSSKNVPGNIRITRTRTIGPQKRRTRIKSAVCSGKCNYSGQGKKNKERI